MATLSEAERVSLLCDCAEYEHPFTPGHDNACGITSDLWLELPPAEIQARVEAILTARLARVEEERDALWRRTLGRCEGHACCPAPIHVHGCFADIDGKRCDDPLDHLRAALASDPTHTQDGQ